MFVDDEDQRGLRRRRLRQQARRRDRRRHRQVQAVLGRLRQQAADDTDAGRYNPPAPPAQQFRNPVHCADISVDNLVYVCDRVNDRCRSSRKDGKFVKEAFVAKDSLGDGSAWDVAFSKDPQQKYLYIADGRNQKVRIFDRQSLDRADQLRRGRALSRSVLRDAQHRDRLEGQHYTTETYQGRRVQKFIYKGLGPVTKKEQGTVWPRTSRTNASCRLMANG